ncbi:NnrU protein [Sphingomonas astaxanthinifaciens DSM 22298]|uniref:NnrU protein n=2 Tax=Sphingomonas TaxID=13687 RepID=A0ABQ5Z5X3_9SPHN|nr:NnrU protein [Sphingomonas astaxanthinifaciens DSM 22298]
MVAGFGAAFIATHLLMSHPLRQPLAKRLGNAGFQALYSVIALVTFGGMVWARKGAGPEPLLWQPQPWAWIVAAFLTWSAAMLLVGSFRRNPAMVTFGPGSEVKIGAPSGVFRITRHPMMWGFALWAISHILVHPEPSAITLALVVLIMALAGSAGQDVKKRRHLGVAWEQWVARTSFMPFGRGLHGPGAFAAVGGTLLWLGATWLHPMPVGLWQWLA